MDNTFKIIFSLINLTTVLLLFAVIFLFKCWLILMTNGQLKRQLGACM